MLAPGVMVTAEIVEALRAEALAGRHRAALERLRALTPSRGERRAAASMISAFERGLGWGKEIAGASRASDGAAFRRTVHAALDALAEGRGRAAADRYGIDECARLGVSSAECGVTAVRKQAWPRCKPQCSFVRDACCTVVTKASA
ncbi:MAG TPA: hypothetical protein VE549_03180 [Myxococcaceae bacterium]|nr:hypothetical protein [Myxococcaceae bacterium]